LDPEQGLLGICPEDKRMNGRSKSARQINEGVPLPLWKRALDFVCLIIAAPALLPLMIAIALIIRFSSRGPILFRQERIGLHGRSFVCFKFRTMKADAETRSHEVYLEKLINSSAPMKKMDSKGDRRILPIGHLLRASGFDELPQIFNVLRGDMSLVGPRPCIRYEYEKYRPEHLERFNVVPGLTGLWQVSDKNKTSFQDMIELDVHYARNLSLRQDLLILFRTLPVLFLQTAETWQRNDQVATAGQTVRPRRTKTQKLTSV
jgi:lipopolysaccharide/colanic/teichoic acid biosynthesis glycosyltransferase